MSRTPICDRWEYESYSSGLVVPLNVAKELETELADKDKQLAEARAEIERKDKLIEQMREIINDYRIEHKAWCNHDPDNAKECTCGLSEKVKAALSAAERGE